MPLTSEQQEAVVTRFSDVTNYFRVLRNESDRGCALVVASHLDYLLGELIKAHMIDDPERERLFKGSEVLASFGARTKIAHLLGLISREMRNELDTIRAIRNDFAHELKFEDFNNESVKARCMNLRYDVFQNSQNPRQRFTNAAATLIVIIDFERKWASPGIRASSRTLELAVIEDIQNAASSISGGTAAQT